MDYTPTESSNVDAIAAEVRRGIREADPPDVGIRDWVPLAIELRADDGTLVGGLYGATMWGWLTIDGLWVAEGLRGKGLGRRVLQTAEAVAVRRGCHGAWLGTFDFQAREFYEKMGYSVFGSVPDFPRGHTHHELWKSLSPIGEGGDR
jgi:GNAT superfamily N-acetyltransferase